MASVPGGLAQARQLQQAGDLDRAEEICRELLGRQPGHVEAWQLLGDVCHRRGRLEEALRCFYQVLALRPKAADTHHALGLVLQDQGNLAEAERAFREAVRLRRDFLAAYLSLGIVLLTQGKGKEPEDCFRKVLRGNANQPEALSHLGIALQAQGKLDEAASCFRKALRLKPDFAIAYNNLGGLFLNQGKLSDAAVCFRKAIRLDPDCPEAHYNLGNILQMQSELDKAAACYRHAIRLRPGYTMAHFNLGATLVADYQPELAIDCFRQALRLQPNLAAAHAGLGLLLLEEGRREEAVDNFREALHFDPACASALGAVAFHGLYPLSDAELGRMHTLLADPRLAPDDGARLHFGLANVHDRAGAYHEAFAHFSQANALRRRMFREVGRTFDADKHSGWIDRIIATCDAAYFRRVEKLGRDTDRPVFIVGMPRSGTSLVEQILASHPAVFGAGELLQIGRLAKQLPSRPGVKERHPEGLTQLDAATASALADQYLQYIDQLSASAARVTDKMPNNFQFLGLIAALFPRARVIHCQRDPVDVCFSCFIQDFKDYTSDLGNLARYYRDYERLMAHWRSVLPLPFLEVVYEKMVEDPEAVSRRLVSFCGLDWDDRCLAFYQNQRAVRTASLLQVRQPVYKSSVARWRRYAVHLRPLLDALGRSPEQTAELPTRAE